MPLRTLNFGYFDVLCMLASLSTLIAMRGYLCSTILLMAFLGLNREIFVVSCSQCTNVLEDCLCGLVYLFIFMYSIFFFRRVKSFIGIICGTIGELELT